MRPCKNPTMIALWRTAYISHFFACKVWIFIYFNGGFFFCFLCLLKNKGSWSSREGGSYYFFKEGDLKRFCKEGGIFYRTPPFFTLPVSHCSVKEFDLLTCAGRDFLTFKKAHLKISRAISFLLSTQVFHKTQSFHGAPAKHYSIGAVLVGQEL
jgi:hypothetical protein